MKESVAIAKEADAKKGVSPTKSDNSIQRVRNEPERQLGSLRDVIGNIRRDGGTPSVESIATRLSGMPTGERAPALLALQQTHGNRYVQRVVSGIHAKLVVGQPGDIYEQEADRIADQLSRQDIPEEEQEYKLEITATPSPQDVNGNRGIDEDLESRLNRNKCGGISLSTDLRSFFEPRLMHDFSNVRVHTNSEADQMNRDFGARAFALGPDIYFQAGQYNPHSIEGKRLLAHELTHVVQESKKGDQQSSTNTVRRVITGDPMTESISEPERFLRLLTDEELQLLIYQLEAEYTGEGYGEAAEGGPEGQSVPPETLAEIRAENLLLLHHEDARRRELEPHEVLQSMFTRTGQRLDVLGRQLDHDQTMLNQSASQALDNFTNFSGITDPSGVQFNEIFALALTIVPGGSIAARLGGGTLGTVYEALARTASTTSVSRSVATASAVSSRGRGVARAQLVSRIGEENLRTAQGRHEAITAYLQVFQDRINNNESNQDELRSIHAEIDAEIDALQRIGENDYVAASRQAELRLYRAYYVPRDGRARVRIEYPRTPMGIPSRPRIGGDLPQAVRDRLIELTGQPVLEIFRQWGVPYVVVGARYGEGYRELGQAMQQE